MEKKKYWIRKLFEREPERRAHIFRKCCWICDYQYFKTMTAYSAWSIKPKFATSVLNWQTWTTLMQANVSFSDPHVTFEVSLCSHLLLVTSPVKKAATAKCQIVFLQLLLIWPFSSSEADKRHLAKLGWKKKKRSEHWKEFLKEYFWVHPSTFGLLLYDAN